MDALQAPLTPPPPEVPPVVISSKFSALPYVVLGVVLVALIATGAIMWIKRPTKPSPQPQLAQVIPPSPTPEALFLKLTSPTSGEQAVDGEIIVSGQTLPNTTVLVYTESDQTSVESDSSGLFETTITLGKGSNALTVTAFGDNGDESSQSIDVVYDSQNQ
ncbi:hypothetical protein A2634_05290 [Candidatus Amesbacteria bacterium RIFCSPHIGHO2_01_FULL_48_32]|uniref:Bacterial Ig-like domain-containing protein n=1 Tax=Candidatus Amesbacteria bacterium RIFCSPLOWO2_01_FULL_48_25 TaxID=1797259 RepID=A0A1F4ZCT2_9BACT|nr:MAG: hypothetical protein A2634_05290 [Candidatus Amesbacteria bacterium RIFCSPHIGHO2_01_FULL_48_32]OGD04081.1 MAG: hypothetical protein A2989_01635 [Candidatus Amesbacteria bacterium RIFCSPLOWO2_01_FULL_48_25]HJZ05653.1 hypothetical protein [Patescibacteria group bacterium]